MNPRSLSLLCLAATILFVCPRQVGAEQPTKKERCPFAGTYTGTFTAMNAAGEQEGECAWTVDDDGNITGDAVAKRDNITLKIKGNILKDNKIAQVFEFADGQKRNAYGTIAKMANGGISGTVTERDGTTFMCSVEFELKPKK